MNEIPPVVTPALRSGPTGSLLRGAYGLAAEIRAVEDGHNARVLPDGSVLVKANSQPGSYRVWIRGVDAGVLLFGCTCLSGFHRRSLPVPCKHAALAGRRLEREGLARWEDGTWLPRERAVVRGMRRLLADTVRRQPRAEAGKVSVVDDPREDTPAAA